MYALCAGLEFFFAVISVVLLVGCLFDQDRGRLTNRIMTAMLLVHAIMNAVDACVWLWCDVPELLTLMKVLTFVSYLLGSAIFVMFSFLLVCYIRENARVPKWITRYIICLGVIMVLSEAVLLLTGKCYYWDENGVCQLGELHFISQAFGIAFLLFNIVLIFAYRGALIKRDCVVLTLYSVIPLVSFAFVPMWDVVPLYMASTIALLLYYMIIHVEHGQRAAEQQALLAKQALELTDSRTAVMLSQIQPHFVYNTLTAIAQLCEADPRRAKETTIRFSEYLRQNMSALTQNEPVQFERELEHVRTYLSIEKVRFGDELKIEYDIRTTDFLIPPLCLQPIVENAVKHGVGMKEEGGTVTIRTSECDDGVEITVCDDGVGFDPQNIGSDGRTHIGMRNARERLLKLMGAQMSIESEAGRGTTVTILIPGEVAE